MVEWGSSEHYLYVLETQNKIVEKAEQDLMLEKQKLSGFQFLYEQAKLVELNKKEEVKDA